MPHCAQVCAPWLRLAEMAAGRDLAQCIVKLSQAPNKFRQIPSHSGVHNTAVRFSRLLDNHALVMLHSATECYTDSSLASIHQDDPPRVRLYSWVPRESPRCQTLHFIAIGSIGRGKWRDPRKIDEYIHKEGRLERHISHNLLVEFTFPICTATKRETSSNLTKSIESIMHLLKSTLWLHAYLVLECVAPVAVWAVPLNHPNIASRSSSSSESSAELSNPSDSIQPPTSAQPPSAQVDSMDSARVLIEPRGKPPPRTVYLWGNSKSKSPKSAGRNGGRTSQYSSQKAATRAIHQQNHPVSGDSRDTPQILSNLRVIKVL
ncbi:hypothetical protein EV361DRAFT_68700 [Lentinula raphanica]|nr:hypothetical protein EV361DRAFT_68700 [Lentinula raphanica]